MGVPDRCRGPRTSGPLIVQAYGGVLLEPRRWPGRTGVLCVRGRRPAAIPFEPKGSSQGGNELLRLFATIRLTSPRDSCIDVHVLTSEAADVEDSEG